MTQKLKKKKSFLILKLTIGSENYEWDYSKYGPDYWPHIIGDHQCNGNSQSPINIDISQTKFTAALKPIEFYEYNQSVYWTLKQENTGRTKLYFLFL